ncbi:MAG: T9SS type A sorting domain-containing protein [Ignavibacteriae bacterium]|nr:T9SS type A sorting domain-containing protein [Ignavibacteriota bacterium]
MKFSTVALLMVVGVQLAGAQITLGPDKIPAAGDHYTSTSMDTTNVEPGTAGSNKIWNFSTLVPDGDATTFYYVNPSATPYGQEFPAASLASYIVESSDTTYAYFSTASNRLGHLGSAGAEFLFRYADPEIQLPTPLNYNDQFTDQFRGETVGDGYVMRTSGSLMIINDSYGTISLPGGRTFPAARVKFFRQSNDTVYVNGLPAFSSQTTTTSYEWFIASVKFPVLQIAYYTHTSGTGTFSSMLVELNSDVATGVKERRQEGVASKFTLEQNFPNPFNPTTTISFQLPEGGNVSLKIYNLLGQEVATLVDEELESGIYAIPFDAKGLASGSYIYRMQAGNSIQTRKLTVLK